MNEPQLKKLFRDKLKSEFIIKPDVKGNFLVDNTDVEVDFLIYPKDHLIKNGFDEFWIGIEVKSPSVKEPVKQGLKVAWQAITYAQSEFTDNKSEPNIERIRPAFVLIFPHISEFFPKIKAVGVKGAIYDFNQSYVINSLMQKGNVGNFELNSTGDEWRISFGGGQLYYSTKKGKGKVLNLGVKRHVGCK